MSVLLRRDRPREGKPYFTILLTSPERNVMLVNAIRQAGNAVGLNPRIIACDQRPRESPAALLSDAAYLVPARDDPRYLRALIDVCVVHRVDLVVPTTTFDVALLNGNRESFEAVGVAVALGDTPLPPKAKSVAPRTRQGAGKDGDTERRYRIVLYFDRSGELQTIIPCEQLLDEGVERLITRRHAGISAAIRSWLAGARSAQPIVTLDALLDGSGELMIEDVPLDLADTIETAHKAGAQLIKWLLQDHAGLGAEPNDVWQEGVEMLRYSAAMYLLPRANNSSSEDLRSEGVSY